jgi:hypothetical protein
VRRAPLPLLCLLGAAACACSPQLSLEADTHPIPFDLVAGVPVTVAEIPGRDPLRLLVDTASPLSAIDSLGAETSLELIGELRLMRADDPRVARAVLHDLGLLRTPLYQAGTTTPVAVAGILGGDVLRHYSVRFDYKAPGATMTFTERDYDQSKPETDDDLARAGRVVVRSYVLGGGRYVIGSLEGSYPATRMTVPACALLGGRAVDLTLLVATGYGPLVLGRNSAQRVLGRAIGTAEVDRLYVPTFAGGVAVVERGTLFGADPTALAIVGDEHGENTQVTSDFGGPCTQLLRHQTFLGGPPAPECPAGSSIGPGPGGSRVGAAFVEICSSAAPLSYVVIADEEPVLQSVRAELRPHAAEIDGFAGTEVLKYLSTELNYTNSRVIVSCADGMVGCHGYPRFAFPVAP